MPFPVDAASTGSTQAFPVKPIRFIVGPSSDVLPRTVGQRLSTTWGQQIIIDSRPGGGGAIAADIAAKAAPDGYTWLLSSAAYTINAALYPRLSYDFIRDFSPVTLLAGAPFYLLVHPSVPAKSVAELIELSRAKNGQLNYGSAGNGTPGHLAAEMFKSMARIGMVHVPYKNSAASVIEHIGGQVRVSFQYGPVTLPHVRSGKLRALAVTSAKRSSFTPELPTMIESGLPGYEVLGWTGVHVPARTPPALVNKINNDIRAALQDPDAQERICSFGLEIVGNSAEEFASFVRADLARWAKVIKDANIQAE